MEIKKNLSVILQMKEKKRILKGYLGNYPAWFDLRKKEILKDNIDINQWEINMEYLEEGFSIISRGKDSDKKTPLVEIISDGISFLWPVVHKKIDNWFVAAYPDVIMYFYPSVNIKLGHEIINKKMMDVEKDFQELKKYLTPKKLNHPLNLIYIKRFYKKMLNKKLLLEGKAPESFKKQQLSGDWQQIALRAEQLNIKGDYRGVLELLEPYIGNPSNKNTSFFNELGIAYGKIGSQLQGTAFWHKAYDCHKKAYRINRHEPIYMFNLGIAADWIKNYKEAEELLTKYIKSGDTRRLKMATDILTEIKESGVLF